MRKLFIILMSVFVICYGSVVLAGNLVCSDYNHDYLGELEYGIQHAATTGEAFHFSGLCRVSRQLHFIADGPYDRLTIVGDGKDASIIWFDYDNSEDAFVIEGMERRLPLTLKDFSIKRNNDWIPNAAKNLRLFRVTNFLISGMGIYGANGFSLAVQDSELGQISNNIVGWTANGSGADGIHIEAPGSDIIVSNNTLIGCGDDSISVGSHIDGAYISNVIIDNNTVWGGDRGGIKVHEGAQHVIVRGNNVHDVALPCYAVTTEGYSTSGIFDVLLDGNQGHNCGENFININEKGSSINRVVLHGNTGNSYHGEFVHKTGSPSGVVEFDSVR